MDSNRGHERRSTHFGDNFSSLDEVTTALREAGLETSNLIIGIDFTRGDEESGRQSLHAIGDDMSNPYEQAISIVGRTLSPFDKDGLIRCFGFGFGDASTHDQSVFSFHPDHHHCCGFEEALARYKEIVPHVELSGPRSFAPIIVTATDMVARSKGQFHILVIIASGQVARDGNARRRRRSPQERATIDAIVKASRYPLSIILVGVGDGPWDAMKQFDDNLRGRAFDNFQFVNFTKMMSENKREKEPELAHSPYDGGPLELRNLLQELALDNPKKETAFAVAAFQKVPLQYKAARSISRINGTGTGLCPWPLPPPLVSGRSTQETASAEVVCPICLTNPRDMAFGCGHLTCRDCSETLLTCPLCRELIKTRLRLFT